MDDGSDNFQLEQEIDSLRTERHGLIIGALLSIVAYALISIAATVVSLVLDGRMADIIHGSTKLSDVTDYAVVGFLLIVWAFYFLRSVFRYIKISLEISSLKKRLQ